MWNFEYVYQKLSSKFYFVKPSSHYTWSVIINFTFSHATKSTMKQILTLCNYMGKKILGCKFINILHYITPYKAWKVINKNLEEITKEKERGLRGHTSPFQDDTLYPHNQGFPPQEHASLSTKIVGDGKIRCQK